MCIVCVCLCVCRSGVLVKDCPCLAAASSEGQCNCCPCLLLVNNTLHLYIYIYKKKKMADSVDSPKEKMGENKIPLQKKKKKKTIRGPLLDSGATAYLHSTYTHTYSKYIGYIYILHIHINYLLNRMPHL